VKLESGAWLTPSIQLLRQIDEGAMGSVWAADHLALGTEVAVKFVADAHAKNRNVRRRLEAEAKAAARIKSPHVVQVFDVAETVDEKPFIVMEMLEGETLRRRLDRGELLSPTEIALVMMQACRALHIAHRMGIVHRDIKPENLFLLDDDDSLFLKILDFGIAKGLTKGLTEPGVILGTPVYICRELLTDRRSDHRSDLWSLSVVAYEALTGQLPFDGETLDEVFAAIWRGRYPPPSEVDPSLSPELDAWFERALHKDRQERPANAKELAATFLEAIATVARDLAPNSVEDWRISQLSLLAYRPPSNPASTSNPEIIPASVPPISSSPRPSDSPPESFRPDANAHRVAFDTHESVAVTTIDPEAATVPPPSASGTIVSPGFASVPSPPRRRWRVPAAFAAAVMTALLIVATRAPDPLHLDGGITPTAADLARAAPTPEPEPPEAPTIEPAAPVEREPVEPPNIANPQPAKARLPSPPKAASPRAHPLPAPPPPAQPGPKAPEKDLGF
jgi:eukaryotic-like serine/threonine-protein kinase